MSVVQVAGASPVPVGVAHPAMPKWLHLSSEVRSALASPGDSPARLADLHHRLSSASRTLLASWPGLPPVFRSSLADECSDLLSALEAACRAAWALEPSVPCDTLLVVELLDAPASLPLDEHESLLASSWLSWGVASSLSQYAVLAPAAVLPELRLAAARCPSLLLEVPLSPGDLPDALEVAVHLWDRGSQVLDDLGAALAAARAVLS